MPVDIARLRVIVEGDASGLKNIDKKVDSTTKKVEEGSKRASKAAANLSKAGSMLTSIGSSLTASVTAPILAAGAASLKVSGQFDQSLRNIDSLAHLSASGFQQLRKDVISLTDDRNIRQGPKDLADGLYEIYSSGFKGNAALENLKQSALGASAGMTSTATSSRVLLASMNSGIKGAETAKGTMDSLFQIVNLGVLSFENLAGSVGKVLPTAKMMGVSLQEVGAAIATMTRQGLSGAESVTSLNNLLAKIANPSEKAKKVFQELGLSFGANALQAKGLGGWLDELNSKVGNNKQRMFELIPELRGMRGEMLLATDNAKLYKEMLQGMGDASKGAGATMEAATRQNKGAAAQWELLKKEAELTGLAIGEVLMPPARELMAWARQALDWFRKLPEPVQKFGVTLALVAAAVGPLLAGLGNMLSLLGTLAGSWGSISAVLAVAGEALAAVAAFLTGPVGIAIAAVVASLVGLYFAWKNNFLGIRDLINVYIGELKAAFAEQTAVIRDWIKENRPLIERTWNQIKYYVTTAVTAIKNVVNIALRIIAIWWKEHGETVMGIIGPLWDWLKLNFSTGLKLILSHVKLAMQLFTGDWKGAAQTIREISETMWNWLKGTFEQGTKVVLNLLKLLWDNIQAMQQGAMEAGTKLGKAIWQGLVNGIKGGWKWVSDAARGLAENAVSSAKTALQIQSPSRVMQQVGAQVAAGLVLGMLGGVGAVQAASMTLGDAVTARMPAPKGFKFHGKRSLAPMPVGPQRDAFGRFLPKSETEKETAAFGKLLAQAKAQLAELRSGGSELAADLAGKFRHITEARREELQVTLQQINAIKAEREARETASRIMEDAKRTIRESWASIYSDPKDQIAMLEFGKRFDQLTSATNRNAVATLAYARQQKQTWSEMGKQWEDLFTQLATGTKQAEDTRKAWEDFADTVGKAVAGELKPAQDELARARQELLYLQQGTEAGRVAVRLYGKEFFELSKPIQQYILDIVAAQAQTAALKAELEGSYSAIPAVLSRARQVVGQFVRVAEDDGRRFLVALLGGDNPGDALRGLLASLRRGLAETVVDLIGDAIRPQMLEIAQDIGRELIAASKGSAGALGKIVGDVYGLLALTGAQGKKKQRGSLFGAALALIAAPFTGGASLAYIPAAAAAGAFLADPSLESAIGAGAAYAGVSRSAAAPSVNVNIYGGVNNAGDLQSLEENITSSVQTALANS